MNRQKPEPKGIGWCDWTWNPISGCLHGCEYCYMRRMEKRFPGIMEPAFHPERLLQPRKVKKPSLIFTGSSGDMWGRWVKKYWIGYVLDVCSHVAPHHTYQFLTKNPKRYMDFKPLSNCWYGTTSDGTMRTLGNFTGLTRYVKGDFIKFVSFEPLLNEVWPELSGIDWVIIGADSTRGAKKPPKEWADIIIEAARKRNIPVFIKDNFGYPDRIKEMPMR